MAAFLWVTPAAAQQGDEDRAVERLLAHSEVESILSGVKPRLEEMLKALTGEAIITAELFNALEEHLSIAALRREMVESFGSYGDVERFEAALALMESGPVARLDSLVEANEPAESLEAYAGSLETSPPPETRVQVAARLTAAQSAGDFFVLIDERTREAAHLIAAAIREDVPPFEPIDEAAWQEAARRNFYGALISFLHRYQAADDALLAEVAAAWESEAGQWYVESYSLALGETIVSAAERILASAERAPGSER